MVNQIKFIQDKIRDIGSAIFFNECDAVLKLPTSIVTSLYVDDFGYVWFFVQKPQQELKEFAQEFPSRLDFFRKGKDYSLRVEGTGWIVTDPEELAAVREFSEELRQKSWSQLVLIKVKIARADIFENITGQKTSWLQSAFQTLQSWILPHSGGYRPTTYYPVSQAS